MYPGLPTGHAKTSFSFQLHLGKFAHRISSLLRDSKGPPLLKTFICRREKLGPTEAERFVESVAEWESDRSSDFVHTTLRTLSTDDTINTSR